MLAPEYAADPLDYSDAPDPGLRDLFHFHDPDELPPPPPPESRWWPIPRTAWAEEAGSDVHALAARLDRWVPNEDEIDVYRGVVDRLLAAVGAREARSAPFDGRFGDLYAHLVKAVAWQESCWRQFVSVRRSAWLTRARSARRPCAIDGTEGERGMGDARRAVATEWTHGRAVRRA
jgi:hypothetical protein